MTDAGFSTQKLPKKHRLFSIPFGLFLYGPWDWVIGVTLSVLFCIKIPFLGETFAEPLFNRREESHKLRCYVPLPQQAFQERWRPLRAGNALVVSADLEETVHLLPATVRWCGNAIPSR